MKTDPMAGADPATIPPPPLRGPGSGKDAWVAFAREVARSNELLWQAVDQQSAAIRELEAELDAPAPAARPAQAEGWAAPVVG